MASMPVELAIVPEDTTIVGDIDAFMEYVESGQALRDWHDRLAVQAEECDAFLREHSHIWSHIIIQGRAYDTSQRQAA